MQISQQLAVLLRTPLEGNGGEACREVARQCWWSGGWQDAQCIWACSRGLSIQGKWVQEEKLTCVVLEKQVWWRWMERWQDSVGPGRQHLSLINRVRPLEMSPLRFCYPQEELRRTNILPATRGCHFASLKHAKVQNIISGPVCELSVYNKIHLSEKISVGKNACCSYYPNLTTDYNFSR